LRHTKLLAPLDYLLSTPHGTLGTFSVFVITSSMPNFQLHTVH